MAAVLVLVNTSIWASRLKRDGSWRPTVAGCHTAVMARQDIAELGTILSIWAHPDDEAYLCGGIMAVATAAASRVVCATATRGELGVTDPVRWPPERLAAIREAELAEGLRILGSRPSRSHRRPSLDTRGGSAYRHWRAARVDQYPGVVGSEPRPLPGAGSRRRRSKAGQTEAFRAAAGEDYYRQLVATERFGRLAPR